MALNTVQFVGLEMVLKAFDKTEIPNWSLWQGKQMLFAYEGDSASESEDELKDWLKLMSKSTNATYTLKFYKDHKKDKPITSTTPETKSFNFRLYLEDQQHLNGHGTVGSVYGSNGELMKMFEKLTEEISGLRAKIAAPAVVPKEEPLQWWEKILASPLGGPLVSKVLGIPMEQVNASMAGAKMSGTGTAAAEETVQIDIDKVLDELEAADPDFDKHMWKLNELAKKQPDQFKMMLGMLDKMQL